MTDTRDVVRDGNAVRLTDCGHTGCSQRLGRHRCARQERASWTPRVVIQRQHRGDDSEGALLAERTTAGIMAGDSA
jgi:hypothetical protein